ncbi:flagellar motor switch protein FliM [Egicoccus sp. AB-alg6-2]|uniref:flagellar motor switch protein FliM n=1 Tax=Egicoccus sp. AB-alg6-2 TaxID=3242692 RepID=UPI00359CDD10
MSRALADVSTTTVTPVDFRRPSRINRDAVVVFEAAHDAFVRRLTSSWTNSTQAAIEIEHLATEQLSVDDYVKTLPTPTLLASVRVGPLGATALLDLDLPLALLLVERLLGGLGDPAESAVPRRPTDLETDLIASGLLAPAVRAIDEALTDIDGEPSELLGIETTPQPMQLSAPGELLLLLTYRVEIRGDLPAQGLISIGYPVAPLLAHLDELSGGGIDADDPGTGQAARGALLDAALDLRVQLGASTLPASVLAGLQPGDVLSLDHPIGRPASLVCDGQELGSAHLGKRGRRSAIQIVQPPASRPPADPLSAMPQELVS